MTEYALTDADGTVRWRGTIDPAPGGGSQPLDVTVPAGDFVVRGVSETRGEGTFTPEEDAAFAGTDTALTIRATGTNLVITTTPSADEGTPEVILQPGDAIPEFAPGGSPVFIRGGKGSPGENGGDSSVVGGACDGAGSLGGNGSVSGGDGARRGGSAALAGGGATSDGGTAARIVAEAAGHAGAGSNGRVTMTGEALLWNGTELKAAFVDPGTGTVADVVDALIAAGLMAAS